jgi:hypothetical protein
MAAAFQACSAALGKLGQPEAAWIAAEGISGGAGSFLGPVVVPGGHEHEHQSERPPRPATGCSPAAHLERQPVNLGTGEVPVPLGEVAAGVRSLPVSVKRRLVAVQLVGDPLERLPFHGVDRIDQGARLARGRPATPGVRSVPADPGASGRPQRRRAAIMMPKSGLLQRPVLCDSVRDVHEQDMVAVTDPRR